jgi:hypothetical protein
MKKQIVSLVLVCAAAFFFAGCATAHHPAARYQAVGVGNHGVIIDTVTGQAWSEYFPADGGSPQPETPGFFNAKAGGNQ